jgi:hypothetical protein
MAARPWWDGKAFGHIDRRVKVATGLQDRTTRAQHWCASLPLTLNLPVCLLVCVCVGGRQWGSVGPYVGRNTPTCGSSAASSCECSSPMPSSCSWASALA